MTRDSLLKALEAERLQPRRERMISIRMSAEDLGRLQAAADVQKVPAAALARLLIVDGLAALQPEKGGKGKR